MAAAQHDASGALDLRLLWSVVWIPAAIVLLVVVVPLGVRVAGGRRLPLAGSWVAIAPSPD
jgi:hypothetical protein